jgi:CubicO group peptidase (beta-lactamase class C family)
MNFEDLQKAWQLQDASAKVTINTGALMKEVRRNQRQFRGTIFWRDVREVSVAAFLTWLFLHWGICDHDWSLCLVASGCFFVGAFIVVDRLIQHQRRPMMNDSLHGCIASSLHQVSHQIWLLKNVFWWYLLPIETGLGVFIAKQAWQQRHAELPVMVSLLFYALFCGVTCWGIYWLNQFAVRKDLEPRRQELEVLLTETGSAVIKSKTKNPTMKIIILLSVLLVAVLTAGVIIASNSPVPNAEPDSSFEAIRKKHDLPALAVVVAKDGRICDRVAVGIRKWGDPTPVTTNDVFHIGSCTKSMTATLTAILIDEGKLNWNTTIADIFPELKGRMDKQYEAVTVEQLLHHRGGVPGAPPAAAWKRAQEESGTPAQQRRKFIEAVLCQPPEAAPGTKMIYSNQGYAIVGAMLEKITGQDYETLITEKLFKPLHMDSAGFGPPGTKNTIDQPWGHIHKFFMTIPMQTDNPPAIAPAGRVHCSLDDLARFAMFHLQRNATNGLLKPETLARLHAPPAGVNIASPMDNYACGWVNLQRGWAGGTAWWHNGSNTIWYIVMWLAPEKNFAVIAATNIAGPDAEQGCDEACVEMIHKWLLEK